MLNIETQEISGTHVVSIEGDVDLSGSPQVRTALLAVCGKTALTVVDMTGVSSIDSSGIASLLEGHQQAKKKGCQLILAASGDSVMRVLGLAKLDDVFQLATTVEAAMELMD